MNQQDSPIVTIESMSHDGRGVARINGKTIFVEGALVGEELAIEYLKKRSRFDEARVSNIIKPSQSRIIPECESFGVCGGCSLQHMDSASQLRLKQTVLLEQLQHIGGVKPAQVLPATTSMNSGYRRKARLGVRFVHKKNKLLIGFREKNGRYLADIESCKVLEPSVGMKFPVLRDFLLSLEAYSHIPQLEIAAGDSATAIILRHLVPLSNKDKDRIKEFAAEQHYHIYLQPGGPETAELFYPADKNPRLNYRLDDFDIEMLFHPTDFIQVNRGINQRLIKLAIDLLNPMSSDYILDLFCGIGNFTLPLSRVCQKVLGVEGSSLMVKRGYENAAHNQINNVKFECKNLADANYNDNWMLADFNGILLDPPRAGAWEIIQLIPQSKATRLVYVSCNPATLARDAGYLCKNGFNLEAVGVLDMFPHTSHVESIALFKRS